MVRFVSWLKGNAVKIGLIAAMFSAMPKAYALSCSEVRQLTLLYFKMHFSFDKFDDEVSKRTLDNFLKGWDTWKLYFYEKDIAEFKSKYETKLDDMINGSLDCTAVDAIMSRYSQRFKERQKHIMQLLKTHKFDFTIDEYMKVDLDEVDYAKTTEEVNERWRKRVKFQLLSLQQSLEDPKKAKEKLIKRYDLALKRHNDLNSDRVYGVFLNAFSSSLDPHSTYLPAEELEDFRIRTRLSLEGIGASLRSEDGFTIVVSLVKGGAAKKGGLLKVNDKIIAVAQGKGDPVDVIDMDLQEVVKKIRGARGTTVNLTVLRKGTKASKKLVIPIVREKIQLEEQQASSRVIDLVDGDNKPVKVGVLTLPSFYIDFEGRAKRLKNYRSSSNDTKREIEKLKKQGIDAMIVDLRSNGGGSLEESINMAGLFFDEGPVVQVKTDDGDVETYFDRDGKTFYEGPLVVMINRHSASASEIFAGAIQDYQRGIVVGDAHTFGKGTVQNLNDLAPQLGAIKVTVHQFFRAAGESTQLNGVSSDITLPSIVDALEIGEKYYDYALAYGKVKSAKFEKFDQVKPYSKKLAQRSTARIAKNKDFQEVESEIKKYKDNKEERSRVSLKEKKAGEDDKDNKDEEVEGEDALNEADGIDLKDDIYLQETLHITTDYLSLMKGKKLKGDSKIPSLIAENKKAGVAQKEDIKKK